MAQRVFTYNGGPAMYGPGPSVQTPVGSAVTYDTAGRLLYNDGARLAPLPPQRQWRDVRRPFGAAPTVAFSDNSTVEVPVPRRPWAMNWRNFGSRAPSNASVEQLNNTGTNVYRGRLPIIRHDARERAFVRGSGVDYVVQPAPRVVTERVIVAERPPPVEYVTMREESPPSTVSSKSLLVEEMRMYTDEPLLWWLFLLLAIAMVVIGVVKIFLCIDAMYFCQFWTAAGLIVFAICGRVHKGDYVEKLWKSKLYIVVGLVVSCLVFACTYLDLHSFSHQSLEISQFGIPLYFDEMQYRMNYFNTYPLYNLSNPTTNLWVCYSLDGIQILLLIGAFFVLTGVVLVIDKFVSSNYIITKQVEPFCEPRLFNPYSQISLGEAQIFIGFVLQSAVYGNDVILWQQVFAPVWAGVLPIIGGILTAISLKLCAEHHRTLNFLAGLTELLSIIASIAAIVLVSVGLAQNLTTLQSSAVMTYTPYSVRLMTASVVLFFISDIACVINVFYALALFIRLLFCFCCHSTDDQQTTTHRIPEFFQTLDDLQYAPPPEPEYAFVRGRPLPAPRRRLVRTYDAPVRPQVPSSAPLPKQYGAIITPMPRLPVVMRSVAGQQPYSYTLRS